MAAILSMIRERFGGVEGYLKTYAGLTDEDLKAIRANMLVPVCESAPVIDPTL